MFKYSILLLCSCFVLQCNAGPITTADSAATIVSGIQQIDLRCTKVVQKQFGENGFKDSYRKGNRRDYGSIPSPHAPMYAPKDLNSQVMIQVETSTDNSEGNNYIRYGLWIQNADDVPRTAQLAWFTVDAKGNISEVPDYLFNVHAQPHQAVQGCVILTNLSAKKHLTYQAY